MESSLVPENVSSPVSASDPIASTAQGDGVSPSSTGNPVYKAPIVEVPPASSPALSAVTATLELCETPPESRDTSYGVKATAVRKLAATTGTVGILGTTAKSSSTELSGSSNDVHIVGATLKHQHRPPIADETIYLPVWYLDEQVVPGDGEKRSNEVEEKIQRSVGSASSDSGRRVPQITETLVASLKTSPVEEGASRTSPDGMDPISTDVSATETQITRSTDVASESQIEGCSGLQKVPKISSDEAKSESASTRTLDNDISSEQMKTNSLSDLSSSDLDEKETSSAVAEQQPLPEPVTTGEHSVESDQKFDMDLKLVEITSDSISDSSQPINKDESTSDSTDNQQNVEQVDEEERLISTPSEGPTTDSIYDDEIERNTAAIKIQSSFRGFKVRKMRFPKQNDDELEEQLTLSEIEIVKEQVEGIIKEAEETTESLRKTPDIIINHGPPTQVINTEDDFPAPPDEILFNQLHEDENDKDTQSLNSEPVPYPNEEAIAPEVQPITISNIKSDSEDKQSPTDNDESTTAELAGMTADVDLPAPDFDLLESSCSEDNYTDVFSSEKVGDERHDSTEGDDTLEEDSEKLKELQNPQKCDELNAKPVLEVEAEVAATKIQANVRGFLSRKQQVERTKQNAGSSSDETGGKNEEFKTDDSPPAVGASQLDETTEETKPAAAVTDVAENVDKDLGDLKFVETSGTDPTQNVTEEQKQGNEISVNKVVEAKNEQKSSPTPQPSEDVGAPVAEEVKRTEVTIDEKDKQLLSTLQLETPDLVEPQEGSIAETLSNIDETLDKMSSQSDSISQDTVSQNTVEELLKNILPLKPSIEENMQGESQDTIDDRTESEIVSDNSINEEPLIKTLPDVEIIVKGVENEGQETPITELPKVITFEIEGNDTSSQSMDESSTNQDKESLFPSSNDNSSNDLPELSSADETKGSSTASTTSDSTKEKPSDFNELTNESDSKATADGDVKEISESEVKKSDKNGEQPKLISEANYVSEAATSDVLTPVPATMASDDTKAASHDVTSPSDDFARTSPVEQSTTVATGAENGKDTSGKRDTQEVPEVAATTNGGSAQDMKEIKKDSQTASLDDSELDKELLNNSATKIQANVRGYPSQKKQSPNGSEN